MPVRVTVLFLLSVLVAPAVAGEATVDEILVRSEPPPGVVFELIDSDPTALAQLIPQVRRHIQALRERFPDLPVAVVSHGPEQFALTRAQAPDAPALHGAVRQLVEEQEVPVHVCGAFAARQGVEAEDFPAYVDVAPSGPAQINNYRALGYLLVRK